MAARNGSMEVLDQEINKVEASLNGVKAALKVKRCDGTLSSNTGDSSDDSSSSTDPENPGKQPTTPSGTPGQKPNGASTDTSKGRPNQMTQNQQMVKPTGKPTTPASNQMAMAANGPRSTGKGSEKAAAVPADGLATVTVKKPSRTGKQADEKVAVAEIPTATNGANIPTATNGANSEMVKQPIPRISQERRMQQLSVAKGKKYGAIGGRINKIHNILKVSRLLQNSNPMVLKAQQALDYIMEIPGIDLPHIQVLMEQWEERFLALLYQYVRLHNRMEYAAETKKLACLATLGGTYKDVRNFEQDLEEVMPGDTVEWENPMVVDDQQPSTSSDHGGKPNGTLSASASKPKKAKKPRKRRHSSGNVSGNDQLVIVQPSQDN